MKKKVHTIEHKTALSGSEFPGTYEYLSWTTKGVQQNNNENKRKKERKNYQV